MNEPCTCGHERSEHHSGKGWCQQSVGRRTCACDLFERATPRDLNEDAFIHARWHRALDNPQAEPPGPIRDHIEMTLAQARADAAEKALAPVLALWREWGEWAREATSEPLSWRRVARDLDDAIRAAVASHQEGGAPRKDANSGARLYCKTLRDMTDSPAILRALDEIEAGFDQGGGA